MTAEPIGDLYWSPDPVKPMRASYTERRDRFEKPALYASVGIRDITP